MKEAVSKPIEKRSWLNVVKAVLIVSIVFCLCAPISVYLARADIALLGFRSFIVLTGSMSPAINAGSLVIVKEKNPEDISVDDILTYKVGAGTVLTHRVVEVDNDDGYSFITKGDANNVPDKTPVTAEQIVGVVIFHIKGIGRLIISLRQPEILITVSSLMFTGILSAHLFKKMAKK